MTDAEKYPYMEKYQQKYRDYQEAIKAYGAAAPTRSLPSGRDSPVQELPAADGSVHVEHSWSAAADDPEQEPPQILSGPPGASYEAACVENPNESQHLLTTRSPAACVESPNESLLLDSSAAALSGGATRDGMCAVCLEGLADTAVVPCGHMCVCFTCMQSIQDSLDAQCPMCRGPITSTIRIYKN